MLILFTVSGFLFAPLAQAQNLESPLEQEVGNIFKNYFEKHEFQVVNYPCVGAQSQNFNFKKVTPNKWHSFNLDELSLKNLDSVSFDVFVINEEIAPLVYVAPLDEVGQPLINEVITLGDDYTFAGSHFLKKYPGQDEGKWAWSWGYQQLTDEQSLIPADISIQLNDKKQIDMGKVCLITRDDAASPGNFSLFEDAFSKGMNLVIFDNEAILKFFNVSFYQDDIPENNEIIVNHNYLTYINDSSGLLKSPKCLGQNLYSLEKDNYSLVKQWLCSRNGRNQNITFISPDFFALPEMTRNFVLGLIRSGGDAVTISENSDQAGEKTVFLNRVGLYKLVGFLLIIISAIWVIIFIKRFFKFFLKYRFQIFQIYFKLLLISGFLLLILFGLQTWIPAAKESISKIPNWFYRGYIMIFVLSNLGLFIITTRTREAVRVRVVNLLQKFNFEEKLVAQWGNRSFFIFSIVWLYAFFFIPGLQWIPLLGVLFSYGLLLAIKQNPFRDYKGEKESLFIKPLILLPIVFVILALFQNFSHNPILNWEAAQFGNPQSIQVLNQDGQPLSATFLSLEKAILIGNPIILSVTRPTALLGFLNKEVSLSVTLESNQALDLAPYNFKTASKRELFAIPYLDQLSLVGKNEKENLKLYRFSHSRTISLPKNGGLGKIVNQMQEEDVLANLLPNSRDEYLKTSFQLNESASQETIWDIPLLGSNPYEFYAESENGNISINIKIIKNAEMVLGTEFLDFILIDRNNAVVDVLRQEINFSDGTGDQIQEINYEGKVTPGIYKIKIQKEDGTQEYLKEGENVGYIISAITINTGATNCKKYRQTSHHSL
ncbi:MAG: hypothetical protein UT55_C0050G0003 [Candidatus Peregrinibacteria bacterium GW2011_GWE2_39_6]|nr:MAG: hypothetical protein UT55_C0050G0003 [Candidatus Peregrinibacteria bacterium GW2011_GWE2_39_6]